MAEVAGYADNMPVGPNETDDGRARNRRVDIVILTGDGAARDEEQADADTVKEKTP